MRKLQKMQGEQGIAMVTSVLVMMVVTIISMLAFRVSQHDLGSSGLAKSRVQAVDAAEAGLNRFFLYMEQASTSNVSCQPITETLSDSPPASYTVTPSFRDANDQPLLVTNVLGSCVPIGTPASVLLKSVGTQGGSSRTMESLVKLSPATGGSFGKSAIFSNGLASITGQLNLFGSPDNADIYGNDNILLTGGGTIYGTVRSQKAITLSGGTAIKRDVYSKGNTTLGLNAVVSGAVNSATGTISGLLGLTSQIKGDANACTGITLLGLTVLGAKNPNACPLAPVTQAMPTFTYDQSAWTAPSLGYHVYTFSGATACTDARNWITTNLNGSNTNNNLIRVAANCTLTLPTSQTVKLGGNLALALDCGISITGGGGIQDMTPGGANLHILAGLNLLGGCGDGGGMTFGGDVFQGSKLTTLLHTPGKISLVPGAGTTLTGQIFGGSLDFKSNLTHTFKGVSVPGVPNGFFKQDLAYIREIKG